MRFDDECKNIVNILRNDNKLEREWVLQGQAMINRRVINTFK